MKALSWFRAVFGILLPIFVIVGGTVAIAAVMIATKPEAEQAEKTVRGLAVFVERAAPQTVQLSVDTQGEVRPRREIDLIPQVSGRIVEVADSFIEGGFFSEGDLLVKIEDADYRLAVTRAEADVARAQRALQSERAEGELARRDWEDLGIGDPSALALREPQLAEARASLAAAQAQLADARLQLARTEIRSPFEGRVRAKSVDIGQYVGPGQQIGRIFATDVVQIRLPLADSELALLGLPVAYQSGPDSPGLEVTLSSMVAGQSRSWSGYIVRTDSAIDTQTRTLFAFAEVVDPYGEGADGTAPLAVGMFVEARIMGREIDDAIVLPRAALRGSDQVFVAKLDGTLDVRTASVVTSDRDRVILADGVVEGEYVVASPLISPIQGMQIEAYARSGELLFPERAEETEEPAEGEPGVDEAVAAADPQGGDQT
jgi:RND family efflux transporter MFP subunit